MYWRLSGYYENKQLAMVSMENLGKIWIREDRISEKRRLKWYKALVKPFLTYTCRSGA